MLPEITYRRCGLVLEPDGSEREAEGVLNPGAVRDREGRLVLYPRMVAPGNISCIGMVRETVANADEPVFERVGIALEPATPYEKRTVHGGEGCEDARVTFVAELDRYVMAYTGFGEAGPRIALAVSHDAYEWRRLGLVRFADDAFNHLPNKDAAFFPEIVKSPSGVPSFAFYHRPMLHQKFDGVAPIAMIESLPNDRRESTYLAYVPADAVRESIDALTDARESVKILDVEPGWGALKNGAGTPPVRTADGWFALFHAVDALVHADGTKSLRYHAGVLVHDIAEPHKILYRSPKPLFGPETPDERIGTVADVVFPTGLIPRGDGRYDVYYGAADARIARLRLELAFAKNEPAVA
jgi:predicted GH43/DUF377 family glycosyl hydrolase